MKPRIEGSKVRRAAFVFLLGSLAIMAITLFVTTDEETWQGMASFGGLLIAALFGIMLVRMGLEAVGLLILVNGTQDTKLRLHETFLLTVESYFITQLIPVTAAGVPYQAYLLTRKGVRAGWATAVVLVKGFVPGVFFFFVIIGVVIAALLGWQGSEKSMTFLKIVGPIALLPTAIIVTMVIITIWRPKLFDRLVRGIGGFLTRKLRGRASDRVRETMELLEEESHVFREALTTLGRTRRWIFVWGALLIVVAFIVEFMVAVVILWGFGFEGTGVGPVVLQGVLKPIIAASPTPGSLAIGEGGYIGFFAAYLPSRFVGVSLVLWRFVVYFVPMFVGGVLVTRRIGRAVIAASRETAEAR
ncbi:MAG: flippase-like domain-containing protein [Candidatus Eisenbacteria bacterium]|nr:flippase-like domain-containing protein [Candidatus Eisenbacteria bacterium]